MNPVDFPVALAAARWVEQEAQALKAGVKLKEGALAEALRVMRRLHDACDLDCFDVEVPSGVDEIDQALTALDGEGSRRARSVTDQVRALRSLVEDSQSACETVAAAPRSVAQVLQSLGRGAADLAARWPDALQAARSRLRQRRTEALVESPEQRLLRRRLDTALRSLVAAKPDDPPMQFLALVAGTRCRVFMGQSVGMTQRNLLARLMGEDGVGAALFRGTCKFEANAYVFISNRASGGLARLLRVAIAQTARRKVAVRARRS